jgi:hypothetical protein
MVGKTGYKWRLKYLQFAVGQGLLYCWCNSVWSSPVMAGSYRSESGWIPAQEIKAVKNRKLETKMLQSWFL